MNKILDELVKRKRRIVLKRWKKGRMEENEREIEWFWNEDELNGMDVIEL